MKRVALVGVGPGNEKLLTIQAKEAIETASLVIGAKRMLEVYTAPEQEKIAEYRPEQIKAALVGRDFEAAAVLFSGDLGFYSGAKKLLPLLDEFDVRLLPGISSVQSFSAALGQPWEDWFLTSVHGVSLDIANIVRTHPKTMLLTGTNPDISDICGQLCEAGLGDAAVSVGENLSYPQQRIIVTDAFHGAEMRFAPLAVLLIENPSAGRAYTFGMADDAFIRGKVPMTKSEVRAVALSKLQLFDGAVVWDVGAGTGSVSVEAAALAPRAKVFAVECNLEGVSLIEQNRDRFGCENLNVVAGKAPEALLPLPAPDCVFIGGSGGELPEILTLVLQKNPHARVVVTCVTLETLAALQNVAAILPITEPEMVQISAARVRKLGKYHMPQAENPVFIVSFDGKERMP